MVRVHVVGSMMVHSLPHREGYFTRRHPLSLLFETDESGMKRGTTWTIRERDLWLSDVIHMIDDNPKSHGHYPKPCFQPLC